MSDVAASPRRRSRVIQIPDRPRGSPNFRFFRFLESLIDDCRASSIGVLRTVPRHRRYSPRRSTRATDALDDEGLINNRIRKILMTGASIEHVSRENSARAARKNERTRKQEREG
ncbi:PREDICTED: uncharacterized protein LOC105149550 [Acromyrmex echinatior]|uniref:uncharacterized protein LOC105149550 n=1 Tax=Acromyrmex echinatior TaxID=103372 RepID=UPI000580D974|nr:PREDICTED: uncharacterized protein LOC105149550 [Acromyrmex echinatior]